MSAALMVGDTVDLVIGREFTPNQMGADITLPGRFGGRLVEWNQYGTAEVLWPDGSQFSYEAALLRKRSDADT